MGKVVYVVDAWNETTEQSVIAVFTTSEKAQRALERILKRPGEWYAGIVKRTVR
jgi:Glu-tRNA(Gln) amidotransferase subunit E-like FAD-binding protein